MPLASIATIFRMALTEYCASRLGGAAKEHNLTWRCSNGGVT